MGAPSRIGWGWSSLLAGVLLASACAEAPKPVARAEKAPPPASSQAPADAAPPPAKGEAPVEKPPASPAAPARVKAVLVDDGGEGDGSPKTLVETARAERERRAHAAAPSVVITDKTLPHLAKGQLTVAEAPKKKAGAAAAPAKAEAAAPVRDEPYWRSRGLEIRLRWRKASDDVKDLERSAAEWRRRFYSEDDPYARDAKVKPEWDRALDRLQATRAEVEAAKRELEAFLEEGRQAGALPGWLREGAEREPRSEPKKAPTAEPIEPPVIQEHGR
jgi:hypothetical protein